MSSDNGGTFFSGSIHVDRLGRPHVYNPQIRGADTGISVGGSESPGSSGIRVEGSTPLKVYGGRISGNDVGIEGREKGQAVIDGTLVQNNSIADFAYNANSGNVRLIDVYAERLFEVTSGQFSNLDLDMNHLANTILQAHSPEQKRNAGLRLRDKLNSVPDWLKGGMKYEIAKLLLNQLGIPI